MPISYLTSSSGPDQPVDNWLSWSSADYGKIKDGDTFITALIGINRSGDIQTIYKPIPVVNDDGKIIAIVGNGSQWKSTPSFSYIDASNIGLVILIEKMENIPLEIRPLESLPKPCIASTTWSGSNNIAVCLIPILAPIFFSQKSIKGSVFDDDFVDKMKAISKKHGKWADLMVEFYNQQEESASDLEKSLTASRTLDVPMPLILKLLLPQVSKLSISLSPPTPASINSPTLQNDNPIKKY